MQQSRATRFTVHSVLIALAVLQFIPVVILLTMSVKSKGQIAVSPLGLSFPMHWENYLTAWRLGIQRYMFNSIGMTLAVLVGGMLLSCITAYVFARYEFPGKGLLFGLILGLMVIPGITTLIPRYVLMRDLKLLNTYWAVILPGIFGANAFNIFVLRTFFASLPEELYESARLDGAGHGPIFFRITIPLSWSIISSLAILQVLGTWNDYIWPLMVLQRDNLRTIAVGLVFFSDVRSPDLGTQMAGSVIASIPMFILFLIAMRTFVEGLSTGALKM